MNMKHEAKLHGDSTSEISTPTPQVVDWETQSLASVLLVTGFLAFKGIGWTVCVRRIKKRKDRQC